MKKELSKSTLNIYKKSYNKLIKLGYKCNMPYDDIMNIINNIKSKEKPILDKSKLNYLKALLYYNKQNITNKPIIDNKSHELIQLFMKSTNDKALLKCRKGQLTESQISKYLKWSDIGNIFNKILDNETTKNKAIIGCFVLQPPRRILDYSLMKYVKNNRNLDTNFNYYVRVKKPYFVFNIYKTATEYGQQIFSVTHQLSLLINSYIDKNNLTTNNLLFDTTDNNLKQIIRNTMNKFCGKNISVNIFRHSYITMMQNNNKLQTTADRLLLAKSMANGITCQLNYFVTDS